MSNSATPFSNTLADPGGQNGTSHTQSRSSRNSKQGQARHAQDITTGETSEEGSEEESERITEIVPYKSPTYMLEKTQGLRRANGARKLKKLSNRHLEIISHHLSGKSGEEIATLIGCTIITISRVLNDPLAVDILSVIYKDRQGEIDALAGAAIDVVRGALLNNGVTTREKLTAVDKFTKLKEVIGKSDGSTKSAEDVVAEIFNKLSIGNDAQVQFNIGLK